MVEEKARTCPYCKRRVYHYDHGGQWAVCSRCDGCWKLSKKDTP